ncbi:MAG: hypothetical protein JW833_02010 [Prolixibacteraceae bacterium]|nr:hypothetical protein [Prolixibacteraceae bacterium]
MKQLIMLLIIVAIGLSVSAQDDYRNDEIQTIFSKNKSNGGYGAFTFGYSQIDGKDAFVTGARGAFIVDHSFAIGIGGYGFVNDLSYKEILTGYDSYVGLAGGYGGIFIEPIIGSRMPVHVSFPVLFGIGGVALVDDTDWWNNHYSYDDEADVYLVIEPSAEVELNLTKFFRAAAYVSYRYTSDVELTSTDPEVLRGWNMGLTFKLGKF